MAYFSADNLRIKPEQDAFLLWSIRDVRISTCYEDSIEKKNPSGSTKGKCTKFIKNKNKNKPIMAT